MPQPSLSLPVAVLLGCLLIAGALLYGRGGGPEAAPPAAASAAAAPPVVADPTTVQRHAVEALAYHRAALVERCYYPNVAGEATPPALRIDFDLNFDAAGAQFARGVAEVGEGRAAVTRCVLEQLPPLFVPAPGAVSKVEVSLVFP